MTGALEPWLFRFTISPFHGIVIVTESPAIPATRPTGDSSMPKELDVPHWATSMVNNFRSELQLPARVTDRMIYARLVETSGMDIADELEAVASLINETEAA